MFEVAHHHYLLSSYSPYGFIMMYSIGIEEWVAIDLLYNEFKFRR